MWGNEFQCIAQFEEFLILETYVLNFNILGILKIIYVINWKFSMLKIKNTCKITDKHIHNSQENNNTLPMQFVLKKVF